MLRKHRRQLSLAGVFMLVALIAGLVLFRTTAYGPKPQTPASQPSSSSSSSSPSNSDSSQNQLIHSDITTTVFWTGESADGDNSYISNQASSWDEQWTSHYGGIDNPDKRTGYAPSTFTPHENAFYVALPYSDFTDRGVRKSSAKSCLNATDSALANYSWCKNTWLAITKGDLTVYAQWEDTGPYQEDDTNYVFGTARPANDVDTKAGLDVSPAVRDYLKLGDVGTTSWHFISASQVPTGPWTKTITTNPGDALD